MKRIDAGLKRYNANTRDADVGDCVPRGISLALGKDYDEVRRDLNRIVRRYYPGSAFNYSIVFYRYLKDTANVTFSNYPDKGVTEGEFCEKYPQGTYLLLTGDKKKAANGRSTHLVCIIDGDIYDSWDSTDYVVVQWAKVKGEKTTLNEVTYEDILDDLMDNLRPYAEKLSNSFKWGTIRFNESYFEPFYDGKKYGHRDKYTFELMLTADLGEVPEDTDYRSNISYGHTFIIKMNPSFDAAENLASLTKKIKQKMYDWVYEIRKDLNDAEKSSSFEFNPKFRGNRKDRKAVMNLPEWFRPLVTAIDTEGYYGYKYEVYFTPLPDDPNHRKDLHLHLKADTLSDLKEMIQIYGDSYDIVEY